MHPFRMCGRIVEVYRYQVACTEEQLTEAGELEAVPVICNCPTQEEAQAVAGQTGGAVTELDSSTFDWLDGLEVADVPDTYAEAVKAFEMGQAAYQRLAAFEESKRAEQLRVDSDYVILMRGL